MAIAPDKFPEAPFHGVIEPVVDDIFIVRGTNIIVHDGARIQTSLTMTVIRENGELILVNAFRLNKQGLQELTKLGPIKHVIRLGAFHGKYDLFYQRSLGAKLWLLPHADVSRGETMDYDLTMSPLPIVQARVFAFKTTKYPEAILLLKKARGVLISCDSIKNWQDQDQFFSAETFAMMKKSGSIGEANIDATWLGAMKPSPEELTAIGGLDFSVLITAHGGALTSDAHNKVLSGIQRALPLLE